jgi:dTDP-4-amino-4,6-dideoxygalactose transaminase
MIPYGRQSISEQDIQEVCEVLRGEFLTTGPLVEKFELELENLVGAPSIAVSSGTAALHCAFAAIGIKPGDEVITPPITFVATQATAALLGAKIVFADISRNTSNINPDLVSRAITRKTKAIVAVDYAGHPAEMAELKRISESNGIFLIEDAAHSLGSTYDGKPVGSLADITTFSFYPTKNITTGEGGAISSPNPELLVKAKLFARQGLIRDPEEFQSTYEGRWQYEVHDFGLNYRLPDILCALGLSQLRRIWDFKKRKRAIFDTYTEELKTLSWMKLPTENSNVTSNWHLFPIRVKHELRNELYEYLHSRGIKVQVNYIPGYRHPVFKSLNINPLSFPESEDFYLSEISLPMYADLSELQVEYVIATLKSFSA